MRVFAFNLLSQDSSKASFKFFGCAGHAGRVLRFQGSLILHNNNVVV